jgi:hypothetical protein
MKTVSILEYDHNEHQFYPSFVIKDDHKDGDHECAFDELVIHTSEEWMSDYSEWNRFGRLPDDPAGTFLDEEDDHSSFSIPIFASLRDLQDFNKRGCDLTQRLARDLALSSATSCGCPIHVVPYRPLYSNMLVGPVTAWWHVKDCNYDLVVPVQRLPVSNQLKARLQAFRCHKGMEFWKNNINSNSETETMMRQLQQERKELQQDVLRELRQGSPTVGIDNAKNKEKSDDDDQVESLASLEALIEQSCPLLAQPRVERDKRFPAERTMHGDVQHRAQAKPSFANPSQLSHLAIQTIAGTTKSAPVIHGF